MNDISDTLQTYRRGYRMITLRVALANHADTPGGEYDEARFTLELPSEHDPDKGRTWRVPLAELGLVQPIAERRAAIRPRSLRLPNALLTGLQDALPPLEERRGLPLWIYLVSPYGMLRHVPWERLLSRFLRMPVLMLPGFAFPPPREASAVLNVALCANSPATSLKSMRLAVERAILCISGASRRHIRIHVFVERRLADPLGAELSRHPTLAEKIVIHDADTAIASTSNGARRSDELCAPWLRWMRNALTRQSIDVVHFLCPGYPSHDYGRLVLADSPFTESGAATASLVDAAQLKTFLTQIGAWSAVFSALPRQGSEAGLRVLADDIAQSRPGPIMLHTISEDLDDQALAEGYRFLYTPSPQSAPQSTGLLIYCQPYQVADALSGGTWPAVVQEAVPTAVSSVSERFFGQDDNAPALIAATERFAEQVQLRYQMLSNHSFLRSPDEMQAALDTLDRLRDAVANLEARRTASVEENSSTSWVADPVEKVSSKSRRSDEEQRVIAWGQE